MLGSELQVALDELASRSRSRYSRRAGGQNTRVFLPVIDREDKIERRRLERRFNRSKCRKITRHIVVTEWKTTGNASGASYQLEQLWTAVDEGIHSSRYRSSTSKTLFVMIKQ